MIFATDTTALIFKAIEWLSSLNLDVMFSQMDKVYPCVLLSMEPTHQNNVCNSSLTEGGGTSDMFGVPGGSLNGLSILKRFKTPPI